MISKLKSIDLKEIVVTGTLLLVPIIFSFILYKSIVIDSFNKISAVSATAALQFWILLIFIIFSIIFYLISKKLNLHELIFYNLILMSILITSSNLTSLALTLKETPLPPYDIRGDLGNLVELAKYAQIHGWSGDVRINGDFYPPLWVSLIGNIARIFNVHVLSIFKPFEFLLLVVTPTATYLIWKKIVPKFLALIIAISISLGSISWKSMGLNLLVPTLVLIFINVYSNKNELKDISRIYDYFSGLLLGILTLWYFGNLWWGIPFFASLILLSVLNKNRHYFLSRQIRIYISMFIVIVPVMVETFYKLNYLLILGLAILLIPINEFLEISRRLNHLKNYLFGIFTPILMIFIFLNLRTNDDWFEGVDSNPATNFYGIFQDSVFFYIIFIILTILILIASEIDWFRNVTFFLIGLLTSSLLGMYYLAALMYKLNLVNLWPRAKEIQYYTFTLLMIIIIYSSGLLLYSKFFHRVKFEINILEKSKFYLVSIIFFLVFLYVTFNLANKTYTSMPFNTFNGAWYAHQGCSNPHVDPLLAKTFEEQPDVEKFLRAKCWGKDWPLVNKQ